MAQPALVTPPDSQQVVKSHPLFPDLQAEIDRVSGNPPLLTTKRDDELYAWLDNQRDSKTSGIILSYHRSGVLESCQHYRSQHVKDKGSMLVLPVSVVHLTVPSECTPSTLFKKLLEELHRNLKFGGLADLRRRSRATLKEYGVKLIIVENAHNLNLKAICELVQIHELLKIPVILSGTKELHEHLKSDWKQVHNSFLSFHQFPAMTFDQTGSVVEKWLSEFLQWTEESDLLYEDLLKKIYNKTAGLNGPLYDMLTQTAICALKKGLSKLDEQTALEILRQMKNAKAE